MCTLRKGTTMSAPPNPVCAENAVLAVTESLACFLHTRV
jgi:hypothetical protein